MITDLERRDPDLRAEILDLADPRWTSLVTTHPLASAFYLPAWTRLVTECYDLPGFAVAGVDRAGTVVGGLPVVAVRRLGRDVKWVSLPFTDYCPPLVTPSWEAAFSPALRAALAAGPARRWQIRADVAGVAGQPAAVRHVLALDGTAEEILARCHPSQVRRNVRRAEREQVTVRRGLEEADLTETFYRLHLGSRRRQGVPVQPRRFFRLLWYHLIAAGHGSVLVAEHAGRPVAAGVFLRHNGTVIYKYGASDRDAWAVRPNHALFWHALQQAVTDGDRWFDWGRTDRHNTGLREFKSSWGSVELPLTYSTLPPGAGAATGGGLTESVPARVLAAVIRRSPPWACAAFGEALYRYTA